jgi:tetratricopeptide (TPR) repeat protein
LQQRENRIIGDDMADTIQVIRSELDNVRAAWSWAGTQCDLDAINKGMRCLSLFYEITSMLQEGERAFSQVVNALNAQQFPEPGKTAPVLSRLLVEKARYLRALSRHEEALQALAEAKTIIKMNPEPVTEATAYLQWAENLERQGDYYGAGKHYKKALALAQKIKSPPLQSSSHIGLGIITGEGGNIAGAVIHFQKALQLSRSNGDRHGENVALHNLSIAAMYQNNMTSARSFFEQQLALVRSLGNRRFEVMVLLAINILSSHFGDYAHLEEHSEKAIQICQEIGDRRELGSALDGSGLAAVCQGRYEDANRALEQALIHHTETGDRAGECISRMYLSLVHRALGEYTQAGNELEGTLTVLRELKAHRDECILLSHLSVTQYLTGEYTRAYQTAIESHELSHQIGDRSLQATALTAMGLGLEGLGNIDEAAVVHQQAQNLRVEAGQEHLVPYNIASLASIALAQGNIPLAQTFGESILHIVIEKPLQGFEPNHVYYAAYCALQAAKDTRSRQVLDIAHQQLQAQAKGIQHPGQRKSFFEKVAANRALLKAWKDIQPTPG